MIFITFYEYNFYKCNFYKCNFYKCNFYKCNFYNGDYLPHCDSASLHRNGSKFIRLRPIRTPRSSLKPHILGHLRRFERGLVFFKK